MSTRDQLSNDQCVEACRCNCGYTCGGPGRCELFAKDAAACIDQHFRRDCDHVFTGWKEGPAPGGGYYGTTVCEKCGLTALGHDEMVGP